MYEKVLTVIAVLLAISVIALFEYIFRLRKSITQKQKDINRRMYELAVLKEIGERAGYSLDVHKIVDILTGSLGQLIEYSVAAYMIVDKDGNLIFKADLDRSVSQVFVKTVQARMTQSLSALLEKDFSKTPVDVTISGAVVIDEIDTPVQSFFNIPIVISGRVVGVLTVADTEAGKYLGDETTILYKLTSQASQAVTRLEEVVRSEQERIRAMVQSLDDGVLMVDKEYRVEIANPSARQAIGLDPKDDVTIFNYMDALKGSFDIRGKLEEAMSLKKVIAEHGVVVRQNFYDVIVSPVYREAGGEKVVIGGLAIFHDTSSEVRSEKIRKDFVSMLVHELRAPIDGIKKTVEVLNDPKRKVPKKRFEVYMGLMHNNARRMLTLINDLLDASKVEAGKFVIVKQDAPLQDIIREQMSLYEAQANEADLTFVTGMSPDVPQQVTVDADRIQQVMSNILSNAIKYTPREGTIAVRTWVQNKRGVFDPQSKALVANMGFFGEPQIAGNVPAVVVAVSNTGPGISKEVIRTLFNKFVQFTSQHQRGQKGSGLGLVIAKGIVEAHGGEINVVSTEGEGVTFYFTLPIEK